MNFCDKLIRLRREKGYSQEQLADLMNVSRQSVSKWEAGQATPELKKLVSLANIFGVTLDNLIRDEQDIREGKDNREERNIQQTPTTSEHPSDSDWRGYRGRNFGNYEYKSKKTLWGIPLIHINTGYGLRVAKGIIAIGNVSIGIISFGGVALGGLCIGGVGFGLIALAGCAIGGLACGGVTLGIVAIGGVAIGVYSMGGVAIASKIAIGGVAVGQTAVGDRPSGEFVLKISDTMTKTQVQNFILEHHPHLWKPLVRFFTLMF